MLNAERKVMEVSGCTPEDLPDEVLRSEQPLVLKGLVADWPMVRAAIRSAMTPTAICGSFTTARRLQSQSVLPK